MLIVIKTLTTVQSISKKINWINYKTDVKGLQIKMDADREKAFIGIVVNQPDKEKHSEIFNQLLEVKTILQSELQEEWLIMYCAVVCRGWLTQDI